MIDGSTEGARPRLWPLCQTSSDQRPLMRHTAVTDCHHLQGTVIFNASIRKVKHSPERPGDRSTRPWVTLLPIMPFVLVFLSYILHSSAWKENTSVFNIVKSPAFIVSLICNFLFSLDLLIFWHGLLSKKWQLFFTPLLVKFVCPSKDWFLAHPALALLVLPLKWSKKPLSPYSLSTWTVVQLSSVRASTPKSLYIYK